MQTLPTPRQLTPFSRLTEYYLEEYIVRIKRRKKQSRKKQRHSSRFPRFLEFGPRFLIPRVRPMAWKNL